MNRLAGPNLAGSSSPVRWPFHGALGRHQRSGHSHYLGLAPVLLCRGSSVPEVPLPRARSGGMPGGLQALCSPASQLEVMRLPSGDTDLLRHPRRAVLHQRFGVLGLDALVAHLASPGTPWRVHGPPLFLARRPRSCTLHQYRRGRAALERSDVPGRLFTTS